MCHFFFRFVFLLFVQLAPQILPVEFMSDVDDARRITPWWSSRVTACAVRMHSSIGFDVEEPTPMGDLACCPSVLPWTRQPSLYVKLKMKFDVCTLFVQAGRFDPNSPQNESESDGREEGYRSINS